MSGDSFLLEFSDKNCILIDCGYSSTYEKELKPLLCDLSIRGFKISLLVITHMDEDHIGGAIALIRDNGNSNKPNVIKIDNIWYNGIFNVCCNNALVLSHLPDKLSEVDEIACRAKTDAGYRDIPIPESASWIIKRCLLLNPTGEYVFVKNGKRINERQLRERLGRLCKKVETTHKSRIRFERRMFQNSWSRVFHHQL